MAPGTAAEVQAVLYACSEEGVAVVPFGGGTSVVGGLEPLRGRYDALVSLDLGRLEGLESLDERSHLAWLRGGTRLPEADHALAQRGFTLGHTPQSYEWATVGGCVATRSAGQSSTGHGRIDENVVALRCATPVGELATLAVPSTAAGPALKQLVIGSEGVLGAITSVGLRVLPLPEAHRYEGYAVRDFEAGWEALRTLVHGELAPDVARLSDEAETRMSFALAGNGAKARAMGKVLRRPLRADLRLGGLGDVDRRAAQARGARAALRGGVAARAGAGRGVGRHALRRAAPARRPARPRRDGGDARDRDHVVEPRDAALGGDARARGLAERPARALPRLARLRDRRLALLHGVRRPGPRRPGGPVAAGQGGGDGRDRRARAARSATTTRSARTTRRGCAPRPARSATTCCACSRSAATRPGS